MNALALPRLRARRRKMRPPGPWFWVALLGVGMVIFSEVWVLGFAGEVGRVVWTLVAAQAVGRSFWPPLRSLGREPSRGYPLDLWVQILVAQILVGMGV